MKVQLHYSFCHTVVLDKDSKCFGVCSEALDLLQINCHELSGNNHKPMMVKKINRYLTKGLKIMTNERNSVRIALEAILLLLYAWNSCPILGTDISRSLVAFGHEFVFPINYSTNKHWELTSSPSSMESYSKDLAVRLSAHSVKLPNYSSRNIKLIITNMLTPAAQTHTFTQLATLCLHNVQFCQTHPRSMLTN
jgi:hypothetical protein